MPDRWPETRLGSLLRLEYGKALPDRERDGIGCPVFGSNGIVGHHSRPLVKGPGIVVGRKGTAGSVTWTHDDFYPIDTTYWVRPLDPDSLNLRFTSLILEQADLPGICAQTGVPGLNRDRAYEINVSLPPLPVQRRIVDLIGALDAQIEALNREAAALALLSHASLDDLVRQAVLSGPAVRLDELLATPVTYGVLKPGPEDKNGVPLIRGQDIQGGTVVAEQVRTISRELDEEYRRSRVATGDLVLVLVGTPGPSGLVPASMNGANISRAVGRLRCGSQLSPDYLLAVLSSPWGRSLLGAEVRGAVQQMINLKELRALAIPVPELEVQARLAAHGLQASRLLRRVEFEGRALTRARAALLGSLLLGEVEIPASYDALLEAV